jgi:hypothetical protein
MKITRREFLEVLGIAGVLGFSSCTGIPVKVDTRKLEQVLNEVEVKKLSAEEISKLSEEDKVKELDRYIGEVKAQMPEIFTGTEQLDYKGKVYAVIFNGTKEEGDHRYLNELVRVHSSLRELGVDDMTVLYHSPEHESAKAIGAIDGTVENLDKTFERINREITEDDVLIFYITGNHKGGNSKTGIAAGNGNFRPEQIRTKYIKVDIDVKTNKPKVAGKNILFLGNTYCWTLGLELKNIPGLIAVNAAGEGRYPTITSNYSINSTIAEAMGRGASPGQALAYAQKEQRIILEYARELGQAEHTDEGSYISKLEMDVFSGQKITETPDLVTDHIKKE